MRRGIREKEFGRSKGRGGGEEELSGCSMKEDATLTLGDRGRGPAKRWGRRCKGLTRLAPEFPSKNGKPIEGG